MLYILWYEKFSFIFSTYFRLSISTSKFPSFVFLTFWWVALFAITIATMKGENLIWQTSSKESVIMNLTKSAASFSESDSDRFRYVFFVVFLGGVVRRRHK